MNFLADGCITIRDIVIVFACIWPVLIISVCVWWIIRDYHPMFDEQLKNADKENETK